MRWVHRGRWVVIDADTVIEGGYLVVDGGTIMAVGRGDGPEGLPWTDHGDVALSPAFVNAHTHLELSALKGRVESRKGFEAWVRALLVERASLSEAALLEAAHDSLGAAMAAGTLVFGEVSTLGVTRPLFDEGRAMGVWFQEQLGAPLSLSMPEAQGEDVLFSLAAHAPHTTAPDAIRGMKALTSAAKRPFTIHLDESEAEREFITTGTGAWADFLTERGIDFSGWPLPAVDPVAYLLSLGVVDATTLVVHLLSSRGPHFARLAAAGATAVCCVRSNRILHGRVPDVAAMVAEGLTVALGTDSLASCESLSILDEMRAVARCAPSLAPHEIFRMATENGARALGLSERFGHLRPGASVPFLRLALADPKRPFSFDWFFDDTLTVTTLCNDSAPHMRVRDLHHG